MCVGMRIVGRSATVLSSSALEIVYLVPTSNLSRFSDFFAHLDDNLDELGIESYGVTTTTLEEVFLRIAADEEEEAAAAAAALEQQRRPQLPSAPIDDSDDLDYEQQQQQQPASRSRSLLVNE